MWNISCSRCGSTACQATWRPACKFNLWCHWFRPRRSRGRLKRSHNNIITWTNPHVKRTPVLSDRSKCFEIETLFISGAIHSTIAVFKLWYVNSPALVMLQTWIIQQIVWLAEWRCAICFSKQWVFYLSSPKNIISHLHSLTSCQNYGALVTFIYIVLLRVLHNTMKSAQHNGNKLQDNEISTT